ncbi:MAG: L-threonine 3-dehydrogenase [Phycisphaeraceae bacterium]|nr:L-threonine 3-dehydrogenase [Phycisphaeraceae bacterium]
MKTAPNGAATSAPAPAASAAASTTPTNGATMRALVKPSSAPGLTLDAHRPVPTLGPRDVLIRVTHAGICGTDRHIYEWDAWAAGRVPPGIVIGHEFVGIIERVGSAVSRFGPTAGIGLRVSAEGHICSGRDYNARTGNAHIARDTQILGVDRDGVFADFVAVPEENVWPVHPSIPDHIAAILDPLGNAVHTVMAANVSAKTVLITGVGIIGLMAVTVAKCAGASRIFVTDLDERRLELARKLGAVRAWKANDPRWIDEVQDLTRGDGPDVLLEMSGHPGAIDDGFKALRMGGTAALLGIPSRPISFDLSSHVIFKGATVLGINGRRMFETWFQMEEMLLSGRLNLDPIVTHRIPLEDFATGFELMQTGEGIKVVMELTKP